MRSLVVGLIVMFFQLTRTAIQSQADFSVPGNFSEEDMLFVRGAKYEGDRILLLPQKWSHDDIIAGLSQAFYIRYITSPLSFTSEFIFQFLGGGSSLMQFDLMGNSYNYPVCNLSSTMAPDLYYCNNLYVLFFWNNSYSDTLNIILGYGNSTDSLGNSTVNLLRNGSVKVWVDYHVKSKASYRIWIAENGTSKPRSPLLDISASLPGKYFYPGFTGICLINSLNSTDCTQVIHSWSFRTVNPHRQKGRESLQY